MERALLWLHEQEVIRLNKGLAVFRPAMTIHLKPESRGFTQADFAALQLHYDNQVLQIHVMAEYAQQGLASMADALHLAMDYFSLNEAFLDRWLPNQKRETSRQTTPASWRDVVESLNNPSSAALLPTIESRPMSWCWPVLAPARPGCWCTASPTWCG